jgi:hypothetical protein
LSNSEEFRNSYNKLPDLYGRIAREYNCEFLDTSKIMVVSELDAVHPDIGQHLKLGKVVSKRVKEIM